MNELPTSEANLPPGSREEMMAALFANMVVQQTNMALMFLGRIPHPQTGQAEMDLESAQMFIDQLEMLNAKTKGNLSRDEDRLLQQSLTGLRMAFVESMKQSNQEAHLEAAQPPRPAPVPAAAPPASPVPIPAPATPPPAPEEESRKKFSKKY